MRQVMRKGLITVAAATGVLAATGGFAHADSHASGAAAGSPGVVSGNTVQVPVNIAPNVCGNAVTVLGVLNSATDNRCGGSSGSSGQGSSSGGESSASGQTGDSPGVGSGNNVQVPVDVSPNVCGNSVDVIGLGGANENNCGGDQGGGIELPPPVEPPVEPPTQPDEPDQPGTPEQPSKPHQPAKPADHEPQGSVSQPAGSEQLAETGSALPLSATLTVGGGALLAGAVLYRKARARA
ncbi:hypothetical protein GCM10018793_18250 [Streptomyces sulfonofaciens]|uniref:Chaplin domain-containing protein n=1 Tax=Streptomyces sulfonofaciens TaxID=68272 RepID=A0A919G0D9_9ACTN|nr:chaplin [Streptomyces sulfonofaciens]GHH75288.1 hypothetical protein GCM10018793_18250 [Streptomyces sulfonofaciens]